MDRIKSVLGAQTGPQHFKVFVSSIGADDVNRALTARAAVASTLLASSELWRQCVISLVEGSTFDSIGLRLAPGARRGNHAEKMSV
jgi:hypothetical protein